MQSLNKDLARAMRHELTWAEKALWRELRNRKLRGLKFRRQQPLGHYILDFYCADKSLVVELDGGQHDIPEEREYDLRRTEFLGKQGLTVLRFWNSQVRENLPWVLELIRRNAGVGEDTLTLGEDTLTLGEDQEDTLTPTLSPKGRGG